MRFSLKFTLCFSLLAFPAYPALIGSITNTLPIEHANPAPVGGVSLRVSIGSIFLNCFNLGECTDLGSFNGLTETSSGDFFEVGPGDPGFVAMAALLTNNVEDIISLPNTFGPSVPANPGGGAGQLESFFGLVPGPDFAGNTIGLFRMRINGVTFSQVQVPSIDPQTFQVTLVPGTRAEIDFTISVFDAGGDPTPEPGTMALFGGALAGAIGIHRRRQRG